MNRTFWVVFLLLAATSAAFYSCNQNYGCTETTADNYNAEAKKDDGTCVPARDKLIGNYRYTKTWEDVIFGGNSVELGTMLATEGKDGFNYFNFFLDGWFLIDGSISQNTLTIDRFTVEDTVPNSGGIIWIRSYSATGEWLEDDTVDMQIQLVTTVPLWDTATADFIEIPQTYEYYFSKQE